VSWLNRSILGQRLAEHFLNPLDVKPKILHALDHVMGFFIAHHLLILRCAFAAERTSLDRLVKRCGREQDFQSPIAPFRGFSTSPVAA
jgi:hypothetical protein